MNGTIASSPMDYMPGPMALTHTRNVRGDLGMFVNPYNCSCSTCRGYIAETQEDEQQQTQEAGMGMSSTLPPQTPSLSLTSGQTLVASEDEDEVRIRAQINSPPTLPPAPPLVRVNAFSYSNTYTPEEIEEQNTMSALMRLRNRLDQQRETVYTNDHRSHDEMAAEDARWDELDEKITAIDTVLTLFGHLPATR